MPMETFNFPYHVEEFAYPESSPIIQFGRGYAFAAKPQGPDQIRITLHFELMKNFIGPLGLLSLTEQPGINLQLLIAFYERHRTYEKFIIISPSRGSLVVRFTKPLSYKMLKGGAGATEPFTIELTTQP